MMKQLRKFEQDAIVKAAQQQKEGMDAATMVREKMMQAIAQQETESRLKRSVLQTIMKVLSKKTLTVRTEL